jgi:guanylate kinase
MSLFDQYNHLNLSPGQKEALIQLSVFFESSRKVFLLKGYAGSGKTTILKGVVNYLKSQKKEFIVMAPTGRAAKVLRDKTGHGVTIHKGIYNFSKLKSVNQDAEDDADHSFHYYFPLNELETNEKIIIVDESSMISNVETKNELFTFGTNILLNDLLSYARLQTSNSKIIFVGDPAQLPPYGDSKSLALDNNYFKELEIEVEETEMTEVLRQENNLILENAKKIRSLLELEHRTQLQLEFDKESFIKTEAIDIVEKYASYFPVPEIGNGVVISFSNAQCYQYNTAIREKIFPKQKEVVAGDLLLINNNNYHTYGAELFNGDIAKVISVDLEIISQSAPVYCDVNGVKVKRNIKFNFRKIIIRIPSHPDEIQCYIIDSLLHSINRDLSICEMKALYINFMIRFNDEQRRRKENGIDWYKVGSEEFKQALKNDPFFNALKVKFGYAITCHKAQGGEWDKVFVDYYGRVSLKTDPLRWCYTATTRGINTVFAINTPQFGKLDKFKFSFLGTIGTLPNDALALDWVTLSPFHSLHAHKCKSLKYWEISEKLENTEYQIKNIESFGGFQERYTVVKDALEIKLDGYHKLSGHFIDPFKVINEVDSIVKTEIENIFNSEFDQLFTINYSPEFDFLGDLCSMMQSCCTDLNITITNIVKGNNSYVNYYLKTDSACSYIQFYYNANGQLTTAMPKTFRCDNDKKLQYLIQKLLEYVI